jgi:hypothetical protein
LKLNSAKSSSGTSPLWLRLKIDPKKEKKRKEKKRKSAVQL